MSQEYNTAPNATLPMGWHKFLIYFSLWASALFCVVTGIMTFSGSHYGGYAQEMYAIFGGMRAVDIAFGLIWIAIGAYAVLTRFALARFRKGASQKLTVLYGANVAANVLYMILASSVMGISLWGEMDGSSYSSLAVSIVMIFVNRAYYAKRASMFAE